MGNPFFRHALSAPVVGRWAVVAGALLLTNALSTCQVHAQSGYADKWIFEVTGDSTTTNVNDVPETTPAPKVQYDYPSGGSS